MRNIEIRPNMRTAGGEAGDILMNGRFTGTLLLVYREGDRVTGSVQLERESLSLADKPHVIRYVQNYIQAFNHAVNAEASDVMITYSSYDRVVMTSAEDEADWMMEGDGEDEAEWSYAVDEDDQDLILMNTEWTHDDYELVLLSETAGSVHYRIYHNANNREAAEARLRFDEADISGDVEWQYEPNEDEIEAITRLLVSDFDEDTVDTFVLRHLHRGMLVETIELTHEALLDDDDRHGSEFGGAPSDRYSATLARDDGDVLTYEIYEHASGALPIGIATVDMQQSRLSGFIDFRERGKAEEAGAIAEVLMRELDKEKDDYDGLSLSLMYKNQFLDEFVIENETFH